MTTEKYTLYPNQQRSLNKIVKFINDGNNRGIAVFPTSFGKSLIIAEIARTFSEHQIICIQPNVELLRQNYKKYHSHSDDGSIYSASANSKETDRVIFGTVGSFKEPLINYLKQCGRKILIIVDESHKGATKGGQISNFYNELPPSTKIIGLTASPFLLRGNQTIMQNEDRTNIFDKFIEIVQIQEMKDIWTPIEYRTSTTPLKNTILENRTEGTITQPITIQEAEEYYNQNNLTDKIIVEIRKLKAEGVKSIMVFVPCIAQIKALRERYPNSGVVYSGMKKDGLDRTKMLNGFLDGEYDVMFNCEVLTLGFDFPELESIIFARPTNSIVLWYQCGGRLVRRHDDKNKTIFVDLSGAYETYGPICDLTFVDTENGDIVLCNKNKRLSGVPNNVESESTDEVKCIIPKAPRKAPENYGDMKFNFGRYDGKWIMETCQKDPKVITYLRGMKHWKMNWDSSKYRPRLQFITAYLKYHDETIEYQNKIKYYWGVRKYLEETYDDIELVEAILVPVTKHIEAKIPLTGPILNKYIDREKKRLKDKRNEIN